MNMWRSSAETFEVAITLAGFRVSLFRIDEKSFRLRLSPVVVKARSNRASVVAEEACSSVVGVACLLLLWWAVVAAVASLVTTRSYGLYSSNITSAVMEKFVKN